MTISLETKHYGPVANLSSSASIDAFSSVSKEIAIKMAKKVKEKFNSDYSIAVTGNAGPGTDGPGSFVGDCFIAVSSKSEIFCEKYNFVSSREDFIYF